MIYSPTPTIIAHVAKLLIMRKKKRRWQLIQRLRQEKRKLFNNRKGKRTRIRMRKSVWQLHNELGPYYFRRGYRMSFPTFEVLYNKLKYQLLKLLKIDESSTKKKPCPNGVIHPSVRLAAAIRMLAGGSLVDIAGCFGISVSAVKDSLDIVLEAIHKTDEFNIHFPENHDEQRKIADGFKLISKAQFENCVGCVDGMLVWIQKPTKIQCKESGVGSDRYFCERKYKFGMNLQAVCNHKRRFTSVSIKCPGKTSDYVAFQLSGIKSMLEQPNFLAPGLCLFGDNAYVNTSYMATPYKKTSSSFTAASRDSYNYYHSNVRINIECAFGIVTRRFGILRMPFTSRYSMEKIVSIVYACCKIHNFLIDLNEEVTNLIDRDELSVLNFGAILVSADDRPVELLHGGEHFGNIGFLGRTPQRRDSSGGKDLPRELLHNLVAEKDLRRPSKKN